MLNCADRTLYTGYTVDLEKRLKHHNEGKASKITRVKLPVRLVYWEEHETKSSALKREIQIKRLTRKQKLKIIMATDRQYLR